MDQSGQIGMARLLRWISILLQGESRLKYAENARLAAELLLVQAIYESRQQGLEGQEEIRERLAALERQMQGTAASDWERRSAHPAPGGMAADDGSPAAGRKAPPASLAGKGPKPETAPGAKKNSIKDGGSAEGSAGSSIGGRASKSPAGQNVSLAEIQERWPEVLEQVKKRKKSTQAFLLEGKPAWLQENNLTVLFREGCSFHKDKVDQAENRKTVEEVLQQMFGMTLTLRNLMEKDFFDRQETAGLKEANQEQALIAKAKDIFGPDLVVVKDESNDKDESNN